MNPDPLSHLLHQRNVLPLDAIQKARHSYQILINSGIRLSFLLFLLDKNFLSPTQIPPLGIAIGSYQILSFLGKGNMAYVFHARHSSGKEVALKILIPDYGAKSIRNARFLQETKVVLTMRHPNLVEGFDGGEWEGSLYFAMELIQGKSLKKLLKERGPLPAEEVLHYGIEIAKALEYIEEKGLIHRDIKPDNIMVLSNGQVKLCDLGIAKWIGGEEQNQLTQTGTILGTPYYISPEMVRGDRNMDIRSDFYSLGATLYHLALGEPPFSGPTPVVIFNKHLLEKLPPYKEFKDRLPRGMYYLLRKMMEKEPSNRYQSSLELKMEMEAVKDGKVSEKTDSFTSTRLAVFPGPRNSSRLFALLIPLVLILGIVLGMVLNSSSQKAISKDKDVQKAQISPPQKAPPLKKETSATLGKTTPPPRLMPIPSSSRQVETHRFYHSNFMALFHKSKIAVTKGLKISYSPIAMIYRPDSHCWAVRANGTKTHFYFMMPQKSLWPPSVTFLLCHLSSFDSKKSYSPIHIFVNDVPVVRDFDAYREHGVTTPAEDSFEIIRNLKEGENHLVLQLGENAATQYFLFRAMILFQPFEFSGMGYLGQSTYSVAGTRFHVREYRHLATGIDFSLVPENLNEGSEPMLVSKCEITQGQWKKVMGNDTEAEKAWKKDKNIPEGSDFPAVYVTQEEARQFAAKLGMELPSSLLWRWSYHALYPKGERKYFWSEENLDNQYLWHHGNTASEAYPHRVALKLPNPLGLYDMAGNVWEWVKDENLARGGSYQDSSPKDFDSNSKKTFEKKGRYPNVGFRVVKKVF